MKKINVAIVGHPIQEAMILIPVLEKMEEIFLVSETIGKNKDEEYNSIFFKIGVNGKNIQVLSVEKIDIFLKYENIIIVDFSKEKDNIDFYIKNNLKYILPGSAAQTESIIELILLL